MEFASHAAGPPGTLPQRLDALYLSCRARTGPGPFHGLITAVDRIAWHSGLYPENGPTSEWMTADFQLISLGPVLLIPTPVRQPSRSVLSSLHFLAMLKVACRSSLASRTALASASIPIVGPTVWHANLYGALPFIGEVHANSPAKDGLHPTAYQWPHSGLLSAFDHARYLPSVPTLLSIFDAF